MKKLILAILLLSLILFASGCDRSQNDVMDVETTATAMATEPPKPVIDPVQIYQDAVQEVLSCATMNMETVIHKEVYVDQQVFHEQMNYCFAYENLDQDSFTGKVVGDVQFGQTHKVTLEETCYDGNLYGRLNNYGYTTSLTQEDFLRRYAPPILLDAENYASVTLEDNTLRFADASCLEEWLHQDVYTLLEASGTARLNDEKQLTGFTYSVSYLYGSVRYVISFETNFLDSEGDLRRPSLKFQWRELDSPDIPIILERAYGYLLDSNSKSISSTRILQSDAAAFSVVTQKELVYHNGDDLKMLNSEYTDYMDLSSGTIGGYSTEEVYSDGVLTYSEDDTPFEPEPYDASEIEEYYSMLIDLRYPSWNRLKEIYISVVQGGYVFDYTLIEDVSEELRLEAQFYLFGEEQYLDLLSSGYELLLTEGYLAIDQYSGLPTANSISYSAAHTIEGEQYQLTMQINQSINAADRNAYSAITGEELEETEIPQQPTPLFYRVTGQDGQEMWLLGTIHIGDARTSHLPQKVYDALSGADSLALEFDMDDFAEQISKDPELANQILMEYVYTDGTTIADHLTLPDLYSAAVQTMKMTGQLQVGTLMFTKPVIWSQIIEEFYLRLGYTLSADDGVDLQLLELAQSQDMPVLNVESGLDQLQMLYGFSDEIQESILASTLSIDPASYNSTQMELYELWCEGDEKKLIAAMEVDTSDMSQEELALYEEYEQAMHNDRNEQMLQVAEGYLESGETVFFAVGLAHLLAEDGLVNALRDAGYTVELVSYS